MGAANAQQSFDHVAIVADTINQTGSYTAGRDIVINETSIKQSDLRFTEINLEPYSSQNYLSPTFTADVLQMMQTRKLAIVGGSYEFDKNSFIRHVAALLAGKNTQYKVLEWVDRAESYSLFSTIAEKKEPVIFVFTQITPQDIKYGLGKFIKLTNDHNHFILMSTDLSVEAWKMPAELSSSYWFEIPSTNLYSDEILTRALVEELESNVEQLKSLSLQTNFHKGSKLIGNLIISDVANRLKTIDQIKVFVRSLAVEKQTISETTVLEIINNITNNKKDLIAQWFNTLNSKEKELLIGLSIFDGLYDDQFFNAIEKLINESWKERNSALVGVDYHDLDTLMSFFNLEEVDEGTRILRSRFSDQRLDLFKAIWFSHRRQLLASLNILVKLIKDSVYRSFLNWELYGNEKRRTQLQEIVSHSLSDMGIINFSSVENVFLQLASDENIEVQEITAKALAHWRKFGLDKELFDILNKWQEESRVNEIIQELLKDKKSESKISSQAFIRSTIALTIAYASEYDKPNELSEHLLKVFNELSQDTNEFVRQRFTRITLPQLTRNHLVQLKDYLFDLTRFGDFVHPIALGISRAYKDYPEQVEQLLNEWLDYCHSNYKKRSKSNRATPRDLVLITIILTLSEIEYEEAYELNAKKACQLIRELQVKEYHEPVKKWYLKFIFNQIGAKGSKISSEILPIIENLSYLDRPTLIKHFVKIYVEQRRNLENSEGTIYFGNKELPIWLNNARPQTEIEITMQEWIIGANRTVQQIAIDALYEFTQKIDLFESEYIKKLKERSMKEREEEDNAQTQPLAQEARITSLEPDLKTKLIVWATLQNSPVRNVLENLLPVLVRNEFSAENLKLVATKLRGSENHSLKVISSYLERFPEILQQYSIFRGLAIILAIVLLFVFLLG